jgi:hypothetical protein
MSVNETAAHRQKQFLADLAQVMRTTAETAQQATIDQARSDAKAYSEHLRARSSSETALLHKTAAADVSAIRDRSKVEMDRVRDETERRIQERNELLEQELAEYHTVFELESERVKDRAKAFRDEVDGFFGELPDGDDPTRYASMAARIPEVPAFGEPDPSALVYKHRARNGQPATPEKETGSSAAETETLPDHWWLDSRKSVAQRTKEPPGAP